MCQNFLKCQKFLECLEISLLFWVEKFKSSKHVTQVKLEFLLFEISRDPEISEVEISGVLEISVSFCLFLEVEIFKAFEFEISK